MQVPRSRDIIITIFVLTTTTTTRLITLPLAHAHRVTTYFLYERENVAMDSKRDPFVQIVL